MSPIFVRTLSGYSEFGTDCLGLVKFFLLLVIVSKDGSAFSLDSDNRPER